MEYGIRARGLSGTGGAVVGSGSGPVGPGLPAGWLETAALGAAYANPLLAAYQLPASSAALLLNSLQSLQSSAAAMELAWKPDKAKHEEEEEEEEDEEEEEERKPEAQQEGAPEDKGHAEDDEGDRSNAEEEEEEEEEEGNETAFESWRETSIPVLSSWMLSAYATMLGRLSAATAAFEAADGSNIASDSDSESDRSSSTDMLSRESSPSSSVRQTYVIEKPKEAGSRTTKKRRTSDKARKASGSKEQATASDANASDTSSSSQGKKRSLALQRVRYRYEREEYRCSLCSYACTIEKAFQRHLRAHARGTASETRVSCAVCGADRSSEVELSRHMRRHRDNRYFCCDICVFRTVQLKKLIQHRRMHTGEKPHLCPHCAYRSARRDNLRSHVRRVHKKENLYCDTFSPRGIFIAPKLQQRPPESQEQQDIEEDEVEEPASPASPASPAAHSILEAELA